ncbi:phage terminase small subunit P27 family [Devosia sp. MC532]|jgi:P27 family predicted phage terminase small subunit|uniref:phage terminase small subunit P27 family n=1 Tax=Devosia sp. MC532 TaxID=2799788 RepID=UPI0018F6E75C|nr:phage terminase small subunit P27 family [Devosia sp. MC532]MBJ7578148.1 phage terminase small subunit P27 family [Devosia sp. MC532]
MTRGRKPNAIVMGSSPVTEVPSPPSYFPKDAKAEWRKIAPILVLERKTLTEADLGTLESYCLSTSSMRQAQRIINVDGLVTADGKRHPAFGIMNAAQTTQRLCAAELGLTPVSRSRPAVRNDAGGDDDDSPLNV